MGDAADFDFGPLPGPLPAALADYPRRWRDEVRPRLRAMEEKRKRAVQYLIAGFVVGVLLAMAAMVFVVQFGPGELAIFAAFFVFILSAGAGSIPYATLSQEVKAALLTPAVEAAGLTYTAKDFPLGRVDTLQGLRLLPGDDRRGGEDRLEGEYRGMRFTLFEAKLEQERKSKNSTSWVTVFRGMIGVVDYPSSALGLTVLARDGGMFDGFGGAKGLERAGLADPKFEKAFTAWTNDQVEARYLLSPTVMEALLALETGFKGRNIRGAFPPGEMLFAFQCGNWFEAGSLFKPLDDPSRATRLLGELAAVFQLLDTLYDCAPKRAAEAPG